MDSKKPKEFGLSTASIKNRTTVAGLDRDHFDLGHLVPTSLYPRRASQKWLFPKSL